MKTTVARKNVGCSSDTGASAFGIEPPVTAVTASLWIANGHQDFWLSGMVEQVSTAHCPASIAAAVSLVL